MPDVKAEALDFRVASGLFAGFREWVKGQGQRT
jgi:hypothetical protein